MAVSIRRATIEDLDLIVPLFDAYRQFYKQRSDAVLARTMEASSLGYRKTCGCGADTFVCLTRR